jgi:hypothetical protein
MIRRLIRRLSSASSAHPSPAPAGTSAPFVDPACAPTGTDVGALTRLVTEAGHPNINDLWRVTKDLEALRLNVKALGYELARTLEAGLQSIPVEHAKRVKLESKPTTQADIEAVWCRSWCAALRERPRYHRRLWECAFVLQALFEGEALLSEAKVLGLGPVDGSVISYLSRNEVRSTVLSASAPPFRDDLTDAFTFQKNVTVHPIEESLKGLKGLEGFDACWSIGQAGHMGSIRKGMDFMLESMEALKPGGLAVHVFDFNFADDQQTIDDWPSVLFQRGHIEALAEEMRARGHEPRPLDFHVGHQPLDRFIDIPPFDNDRTEAFNGLWRDGWQSAHLKTSMDGFAVTSFGLICRRGAN